ncbi:hypothetical protein [Aquisalibacillus elongatus]|uniref:Uncharacterized protein n=1 Tax=Aquisalibacillus elongatus TaxID=485577 RepID=A0A3N5C5C9_9BACI|nr:hypothetical protein [Aquisalibacillus elongatus]RPF53385.1 hypothetical protein EDC24_1884 [Aquisalibacillus elongatus]
MKNRISTLLYFLVVTLVNLYPIYISIAVVGFVNRSGHNIDGWFQVTILGVGLTLLAILITVPIYLIAWQFGHKYIKNFQTRMYTALTSIVILGLFTWYIYTAISLY